MTSLGTTPASLVGNGVVKRSTSMENVVVGSIDKAPGIEEEGEETRLDAVPIVDQNTDVRVKPS